jgi:hypothetical protein
VTTLHKSPSHRLVVWHGLHCAARWCLPTVDVRLLPDSRPRRPAAISHQPPTLLTAVWKLSRNLSVLYYDRRSVGQSVLVSSPHLGLMTRLFHCCTVPVYTAVTWSSLAAAGISNFVSHKSLFVSANSPSYSRSRKLSTTAQSLHWMKFWTNSIHPLPILTTYFPKIYLTAKLIV